MTKTSINETSKWREMTDGGSIYLSGNSKEFITGSWRIDKPLFIQEKCKQCLLCAPVCPDSSIPVKEGKRLDFDYDHCKGCGICESACSFGAIKMVKDEK